MNSDFLSFQPRSRQIPGRSVWQPYAGEEYLVFFDESFYQFFDFTRRDGNFAHGAVGLPASQYEAFKGRLSLTVDAYGKAFQLAMGITPEELKSADVYKLRCQTRHHLMAELKSALESHGGFIAGFYTSNRGYVMERVRGDLVAQNRFKAVPTDHADLYDAKVRELNSAMVGPGNASVVSDLLEFPVLAVSSFFSNLRSPFRVLCDPRQVSEDAAVQGQIEALVTWFHSSEQLGIPSNFLGLSFDKPSHGEFGLQVADLVAGEVRRFFRFHPEMLTEGSGLALIGTDIQPGEVALLDEKDGKLAKKGIQIPIPQPVLGPALQASDDCSFAILADLLASGLVTCVTDFGTQRDINLSGGLFWDLCD